MCVREREREREKYINVEINVSHTHSFFLHDLILILNSLLKISETLVEPLNSRVKSH